MVFRSRAELRLDKEASQTRDRRSRFLTGLAARFGITKGAAARQDPSLRKERVLRMTIEIR
jgi:hypothetical protein